jgi:hypothetical protein
MRQQPAHPPSLPCNRLHQVLQEAIKVPTLYPTPHREGLQCSLATGAAPDRPKRRRGQSSLKQPAAHSAASRAS